MALLVTILLLMFVTSSFSFYKFKLTMNKLMLHNGKAMACLLLLLLVLINGCKKDLLVPKKVANAFPDKIRSIPYSQFIGAIDLNSTGSLKAVLSGQKAKVMSTQALAGNLDLEMDSVKKLTLGDTISYVIAIKPQTPRATTFQNLTIQVINTKTTAFLSTYYPEREWLDNWRKNLKTTFKGTIVFNKINLEDVNSGLANGLEKKQTGLKDRMLASINGKSGLGNVISLLPGECEIYDIVTVVQIPCKHGHLSRSECNYFDYYGTWEPRSDDWPPSTSINTTTVVNCAMPNFPSDGGGTGGGGSGGSTTPNPPGTYNPCDGTPQPAGSGSISFERGTRLMVAAPTDCDELPGPPVITTTQTPQQYLMNHLDLDAAELNFVNNPLNSVAITELSKYLINNGLSTDNTNFVHWSFGYLTENPNINIDNFKNQFMPVTNLIADPYADNWSDPDDEILFDPDQTAYQEYQDQAPWPTIDRVIPFEKYVPMRQIIGPDGNLKNVNCLILAKEQLGKVGYTCSGFLPGTQTFSIYTTQDGVNLTQPRKAISYMITSLSKKIPVLIGVDNRPGAPSANKDNSTDHYVVVVAMGTDEKGKYFQFMDSATNNPSTGASYSNRLYFDPSTGKITGKTAIVGYRTQAGMRDYTVTQIRKSIKN
ncbi:hypothetical protein [Pedobacter sp. KLB.chiD]|uniref:hypothetical protein n=1 Tax=Pedobacter sp. KLB.chiD TaxID=3387402 RepID=UPI00399AEB5B